LRTATWLVILASRVSLNLGVRVTYPFLPAIARGLGIPFEQAGLLVAARHFVGLSSPFWGAVGDRKGHAWCMTAGLLFLFSGALAVSLSRGFFPAMAGFILLGLAKSAYDPSVQAFASARVPYSLRARAIGILETSWALSWLLGMPLSGLLISRFGWQSPFVLLVGAAVLSLVATRSLGEIRSAPPQPSGFQLPTVSTPASTGVVSGTTVLVLLVTLSLTFANENIVIVYGAWLEESFSLQVRALGFFSILVGVAELAGELTVAAVVDRLGKRRGILAGLILVGLTYLVLPFCKASLLSALTGLGAMFFLFEFTLVSIFPYVSELVPARRGALLALNYTCAILGRFIGSLTGPWLWQRHHDLLFLAFLSVASQFVAFILILCVRKDSAGLAGC
jgi:predicted MFS family arabinose efflux permease